jgi:hypothetical protein
VPHQIANANDGGALPMFQHQHMMHVITQRSEVENQSDLKKNALWNH